MENFNKKYKNIKKENEELRKNLGNWRDKFKKRGKYLKNFEKTF